jgi:hypothetical protein
MIEPVILLNESIDRFVPLVSMFLALRRFESPVGIVGGVVKEELKIAVAQCAPGRIEVKLRNGVCQRGRWFVHCIGIEFENKIAVLEFSRIQLFEHVFVGEEPQVPRHGNQSTG